MKTISIRLTSEDAEHFGTNTLLSHDERLVMPRDILNDVQLEIYVIKKIGQLLQFDKKLFNTKRYKLNRVEESYVVVPRELQAA